jgi:hypothetical protein
VGRLRSSYYSLYLLVDSLSPLAVLTVLTRCTHCTQCTTHCTHRFQLWIARRRFSYVLFTAAFTAYSLPIHCLFTAYYCLSKAYSLLIHCLFRGLFTAYSLSSHCRFTVYSLKNRRIITTRHHCTRHQCTPLSLSHRWTRLTSVLVAVYLSRTCTRPTPTVGVVPQELQ